MLNVCYPESLYDRMKVWVWKGGFQEESSFINKQIIGMKGLWVFLENNETLHKVMGMALAIGNIMNGGTPKGQSDGFDFSVIAKLTSTKENAGNTMLKFIMKHLVEADPELPSTFKEQCKVWLTKGNDLEAIIAKFNDIKADHAGASGDLKKVTESGDERDIFMDKMTKALEETKEEIDVIGKDIEFLKGRFAFTLDYFQVDVKSDMRKSTTDFLTYWKRFVKDMEDSLPKEQKKRSGGKVVGGMTDAMRKEMMEKMA